MRRPTQCLVMLAFAGCISHPVAGDLYPWVLPTAEYMDERFTSFEEEMRFLHDRVHRNSLGSPDEITFDFDETVSGLCELYGTNETHRMLADSFHCRPFWQVTFETLTPSDEIVNYFTRLFSEYEWEFVRGMLAVEETLSGGDVVRVYRKGDALVRLHVCGPLTYPDSCDSYEFVVWTFYFSFQGMDPKELLGPRYRDKGREVFCANYHVGEMIRNRRMMKTESNKPIQTKPDGSPDG